MRINDKGLRKADKRQKQYNKKKNGMRISGRSIFTVLTVQKKRADEIKKADARKKKAKKKKARRK